jgi:hypothetical protein
MAVSHDVAVLVAAGRVEATSFAAMGWNRRGESLTTFPLALEAAMPPETASPMTGRSPIPHLPTEG